MRVSNVARLTRGVFFSYFVEDEKNRRSERETSSLPSKWEKIENNFFRVMIWIIIFIKCDGDDNNNTTTYLFNFNICSCFSWIRFYFSDYLIWLVIIHGLFFRLLKTFWILSPCTKNIFLNASRSQLNRSSRHKDVTILILLFNIYYLFVYVSSQYIFLVVIVFFLFICFISGALD